MGIVSIEVRYGGHSDCAGGGVAVNGAVKAMVTKPGQELMPSKDLPERLLVETQLGPPVVPFYPFWGRVPVMKIDSREKGTLIAVLVQNH